ncbi:uncharacterized protein Z519_04503 [Cladophialophora bantiana CBS 173.52]|uniref:mRNA-capping enzyme subunit beta n=1 Tax=Cladophialophora bantiana (strain ATCC 10958 / CBS 173.52 / CDC B-1940 / NIH 8579) TaxID=1442370 RepID=A0A0D2G7E6_CLAB1|nr:uncharacterized protein Z519_04503 [Cladophialophora bantiana CBS 173.52]KIW94527.1 hypothetical protein Z519_04503 [Cladophialophora bantiana CBS 173.52]
MDLKSMLNDSSTQRHQHHPQPQPHPPPRLHTPQSSYEHTPSSYESHAPLERPSLPSSSSSYHHQPPPLSNEYRTSANGSYFAVQSPPQNSASASASTPSATGQSFYAQSPGPHGQIHTPREGIPPSHLYQSPFVPSPSPSAPYPPTPGSVHLYQTATPSSATTYHQSSAHPSLSAQSPTLRDDYISANGLAHAQQRHVSPQAQFHPPPVTPLGPPVTYPRPSPHPHRPTSHGHESVRRSSVGSVGSAQSREYNQPPYPQADHSRSTSGSIQRTYSGDLRERERSIESVSPKTIPKPPPGRQQSVGRYQEPMSDPYPIAQPPRASNSNSVPNAQFHTTPDRVVDNQSHETTPKSFSTSNEPKTGASFLNSRPSPGPAAPNHQNLTPQLTHSSLPAQRSSPIDTHPQPSLKRTASNLSDAATTPFPPTKRPRRDEIPIWARSARRNLPLKFGEPVRLSPSRPRTPRSPRTPGNDVPVKKESVGSQVVNGQVQHHAATPPGEPRWEPSITGNPAYDDLTRHVCDWIYFVIGNAEPPAGGAVFEVEAKVGVIFDEQASNRLNLPVDTETVFSREKFRGRTSFKSSMNMAQHQAMNKFLNHFVFESYRVSQVSGEPPRVDYKHPHEYDEFYELTEEGRRNLPPSIMTWLNPRHTPRVRRTIDEKTNTVKAQIIKSRIADLEVYNPRADFDYRISISIESPWEGDPHWLTEMTEGGRDRKKDRMSYRHLAYQIDLTQVSYPNTTVKEHELEVEISTDQIRIELANLKAGESNRYEKLVGGFVDNVRILCREGTIPRQTK